MLNMFSKKQIILIGSFFLNTSSIAKIAFSLRITELIPIFSGAIDTILFPNINKLFNNEKEKNLKVFRKNLIFNNIIAYLFILGIIVFYPIIILIFGYKYSSTEITLILFGIAYMSDGIGSISGTLLTIEHKLIHNLRRNFSGFLVGLALTLFFLILEFDFQWLSLSFMASQLTCYLIYDLFIYDLRNIGKIKLKSIF